VARAFEAENPGVTVNMSFLENQSFKQKLTTMLQSEITQPDVWKFGCGAIKPPGCSS
jgi:raffinose/stachyose/melibiose transport system substrate-binding protein